jgi:hypothetical protein
MMTIFNSTPRVMFTFQSREGGLSLSTESRDVIARRDKRRKTRRTRKLLRLSSIIRTSLRRAVISTWSRRINKGPL